MAVRQLKDGRWVCYYRHGGKLRFDYFGRGAQAEASAWARHQELNPQKRRPQRPNFGPLFIDLVEGYLSHRVFSENSATHLKTRLRANILPALGVIHAISLNDQILDNYVKTRRSTGVKYTTIHRELSDIQAIVNWAVARKPPLIPSNPVKDYKKPRRDDYIFTPPSREEAIRIMNTAAPHVKRALMLSYYLGLRPGSVELLSLTWENVRWDLGAILVISAHKGGPEKRLVPIHDELLPALKAWHGEDKGEGPIVHIRGRRLQSIKNGWKGAVKRAGIDRRMRPYDLRHYFITKVLEEGGDLKSLAEIVGSKPETLMKHNQHVTTSLHKKTVAKIPPLHQ
jgi:integrase